jgi:hypothetical protein
MNKLVPILIAALFSICFTITVDEESSRAVSMASGGLTFENVTGRGVTP